MKGSAHTTYAVPATALQILLMLARYIPSALDNVVCKLLRAATFAGLLLARATVGMLERLEWNSVSVLCIRPTVLYSVART